LFLVRLRIGVGLRELRDEGVRGLGLAHPYLTVMPRIRRALGRIGALGSPEPHAGPTLASPTRGACSAPFGRRRAGLGAGGVGGLLQFGLRAVLGRRGPATPVAGPTIRGVDLLPPPPSELGPVVRKVAVCW